MKKPTVYLDTNVISAFWYEGEDQTVLNSRWANDARAQAFYPKREAGELTVS